MSIVAFPGQPDLATASVTVTAAVERFLDSLAAATTRAGYAETLTRLTAATGPHHPVAVLQPEHYAAVMDHWNAAAAATWNRHLSALTSFTAWAQRQELLATNPARLLPRLLTGRTTGPVFLTDRRAPTSGRRTPTAADICPVTGRGRLSYPRAEYLFKTTSAKLDPHRQGWTLHQLRHSALQHLAQAGRTAPELQAKSRHQHLASLGRYVRLGEETSARITAEADPVQRRRTR
ncbi:site-specific integrase [Nonomuraea sp. NPDC049028]|uniref:site-specific integrase n=1 Tax=Nonomuraea sp. NPDC049028 TaxID=3364348 RepID=UPI003714F4BD